MDEANSRNSSLAIEFVSFVKTMNATGDWEPYPILLMASRPLGPIQKAVFDEYCSEALNALTDDIDAIYLCHHVRWLLNIWTIQMVLLPRKLEKSWAKVQS